MKIIKINGFKTSKQIAEEILKGERNLETDNLDVIKQLINMGGRSDIRFKFILNDNILNCRELQKYIYDNKLADFTF